MNCHYSGSVPRTGIEPAHPCGYQILSLTRLPIPPSGQGCNNTVSNYTIKIYCRDSFGSGAVLNLIFNTHKILL